MKNENYLDKKLVGNFILTFSFQQIMNIQAVSEGWVEFFPAD